MLQKEYAFYQANRNGLLRKYSGKTLLIHAEKVIGAFETEAEAYIAGTQKFELGTFLIQNCSPEEELQVFHSRAIV